jgi:sugar O-acyltransferase (sialic acid O-acetyltransferase NeuD family)
MHKIAIVGAGGLGKEVAMLLEQINAINTQWEIIGFFDDRIAIGKRINNYKILGTISEISKLEDKTAVVIAIGDSTIRAKVFSKIINQTIYFPTLIHPSALIGNRRCVRIGNGSIVTANCILTVNIEVGKFVLLNLGSTIGHDTIIEDFVSVMPGTNISGEAMVRRKAFIGSGVQILNKVEIGANSIVGAGAVVTKNLPANCTAVGIPAKPIKFHE